MLFNKARRVLAVTLAAGMAALSLTACGGASDTTADGKTRLDFYYPINVGGPLEAVVNGFVEDFEAENPDIDVTPVYSGDYNQTVAAVKAAIDGGEAPAAAVLMSAELKTMNDEGLIQPISELTDDTEWLNSFHPAFLANSTLDGKVASIPFQRSTVVQIWNKDHFKQAGLDPEVPPQTWDELVTMGKQLKEKSDTTWAVQLPSDYPNGAWIFQALTLQNGLKLDNEEGTEVKFNDPKSVEAVKFLQKLTDEGVQQPGTVAWGTLPNEFTAGNASIIWTTTGQLSNIRKNANFDFGVSILQQNEQFGTPTGGGNYYVLADASDKQKEAAVKFAKFLTDPQRQAEWTVASGYVAPSDAAWQTQTLKDYVADFPQAYVAYQQLEYAQAELSPYRRGAVEQAIADALAAAMNGTSAEDATKQGQEQIDGILRDYQ
ncbi:ABC transporter substrate-binding protein [Corynebacterium uterequi]|uniref:ABC-type sugar transport system, periplasmic component n=1 Tax=Corynebacterium uterequi TaxID=1072256 RepID=A0A0G3HB78_9CORY|nr:ABC transporter substrate-binding protein [Corynebacterium uterequi]AKK10574.1 ABC-type sugar transport system, periplasmic component [Corynebacterium uterequi]